MGKHAYQRTDSVVRYIAARCFDARVGRYIEYRSQQCKQRAEYTCQRRFDSESEKPSGTVFFLKGDKGINRNGC